MSESITFERSTPSAVSAVQMAEHEGLVRWVVRRQGLAGLPFDDALHEGRIGLWSALRHYDPSRGTTFSTYAVPTIAHAVWRAVAIQTQRSLGTYGPSPADATSDFAALVHAAQVEAALLDLIDDLPARLHEVIVRHYGLDDQAPQTFAAIGQSMGVTKQRVHQLHVRAIFWLAHPAHSLPLRLLLERHARADYQQTIARQRKLARQQRPSGPARARHGATRRARWSL